MSDDDRDRHIAELESQLSTAREELAALREALDLPDGTPHELHLMAVLHRTLDVLTRLGPRATARALTWAFARYDIQQTISAYMVRDRRAKPRPPAPEPPASSAVATEAALFAALGEGGQQGG